LVISNTLKNNQLIKQYWLLNKADRHHSIEVMNRTLRFSDDLELLQLSLLHDIGKNTGHYSWFLRILSDLKIVSSYKSKKYLDHELIGLEVLSQIGDIDSLVAQYQKNLLQNKHQILDKTDY
jgi:ABC-type enterochelin transport system ATPase subunit